MSVVFKVDVRNIHGSTPLCYACAAGSVECVRLLLDHGASVNPSLTALTSSPLHEACIRGETGNKSGEYAVVVQTQHEPTSKGKLIYILDSYGALMMCVVVCGEGAVPLFITLIQWPSLILDSAALFYLHRITDVKFHSFLAHLLFFCL